MIPFGDHHLRRAIAEFAAHYRGEPNHQAFCDSANLLKLVMSFIDALRNMPGMTNAMILKKPARRNSVSNSQRVSLGPLSAKR